MAVDLMSYTKMDDQMAIQEAATAGIRSMEHLIFQLSQQKSQLNCREITDHTVSKFKKVISILDRTGHARFRRGPTPVQEPFAATTPMMTSPSPIRTIQQPPAPGQPQPMLTLDFTKSKIGGEMACAAASQYSKDSSFSISTPISSANSSFLSSITGDGSVSNGKNGSSLLLPPPIPPTNGTTASAGKPPLSSSYKKRCHSHGDDPAGKYTASGGGGRCHCSKRR